MSRPLVRRNPAVLEQDLGDELLLYRADDTSVHVLNSTGRAIWRLCDGENGMEEIVAHISTSFTCTPDCDVRDDVAALITALTERHLLSP